MKTKTKAPIGTAYVLYDETRTGGEKVDLEDRWSDRRDTHIDYTVKGVRTKKPDYGYERVAVDTIDTNFEVKDGQTVYVVLVKYKTGDTFGSSYGNGHIVGVYNSAEEAFSIKNSIEDGSYEKKVHYAVWTGYFERLQSVTIHTFQVGIG